MNDKKIVSKKNSDYFFTEVYKGLDYKMDRTMKQS